MKLLDYSVSTRNIVTKVTVECNYQHYPPTAVGRTLKGEIYGFWVQKQKSRQPNKNRAKFTTLNLQDIQAKKIFSFEKRFPLAEQDNPHYD